MRLGISFKHGHRLYPPTKILTRGYKAFVCINLMIQVSRVQGHEIRIVSYALLDGGDCLLY